MLLPVLQRGLLKPQTFSIAAKYHSQAVTRPVPPPRGSIQTPKDFLTAIGRSCETKLKVDSWEDMWKMGGYEMKHAGVGVQDRRYILWCLNKLRLGQDPSEIAHPVKPKKKIRGWGPSVQFGKRIRSRRKR
ncbi:hypothetical protein M422DRAFT_222003 [Sphaerobolus stellatus SS14]|nr:hypothetical protein M422DRAFT_222003 [Sphaerobolus stellatus SS14]